VLAEGWVKGVSYRAGAVQQQAPALVLLAGS